MNVETAIKLDRFVPREYQKSLCDAFENKGYKKLLIIWPRRSGKDIVAWNLTIRQALKKIGVYFYIFPTYSQSRKVVWDSITNTGQKFVDYIPPELVDSTNSQEMKIKLKNGSLIQLIGSDNVDSIVGTNPMGCVFSEYALQDPRAYQFIRPILTANGGWALFIGTPRGKNHMWELYQIALNSPEWFCCKFTVDDTNHIPLAEIEKEKQEGIMSIDLIMQEYYTSFTMGVEGAYYAKYLDKMRLNGQISTVPYEQSFKVNTAWDLGVRDSTVIIFFQVIGQTVKIIDYYENNKQGLEHYARVLQEKGYLYGKHFAPHDIGVTEFGSGLSRLEKARELGIKFEFTTTKEGKKVSVVPNLSVSDGIEAVRSTLSKIWIDESRCSALIKALENYRQEYDVKLKVYKSQPLHNFASHGADAMRYLCLSLPKTRDGASSAEELDRRYAKAVYGSNANMPSVFRDDY